jgi:DnaD/phage-associated family protein
VPERGFDTGFWTDPFVVKATKDAKFLFAYLWLNDHCNQAGLYVIAPGTIASETGIAEADLPGLFELIKEKVKWYPEANLVWVKNFIKRQSKSSKFVQGAAKCLTRLNHDEAIQELLDYNHKRYSIDIPYKYYMEKISMPSPSSPLEGEVKEPKSPVATEDIIDPKLAAIVKSYEDNIGVLTPALFERLKDITDTYPEGWFEKAVDEACRHNTRKLGYIEAILERWEREGIKSLKPKEKSNKVGGLEVEE